MASYKGAFLIPRTPFVVDSIYKERSYKPTKGWFVKPIIVPYPAYGSGIEKGDKIIGLNDVAIDYFDQFATETKNIKPKKSRFLYYVKAIRCVLRCN
ncbi:MAG: hypothetical protein HC803_06770 [Saprospiraceae bacterium]|nr:hypothetical protein [Saprospiraceae bacterium]